MCRDVHNCAVKMALLSSFSRYTKHIPAFAISIYWHRAILAHWAAQCPGGNGRQLEEGHNLLTPTNSEKLNTAPAPIRHTPILSLAGAVNGLVHLHLFRSSSNICTLGPVISIPANHGPYWEYKKRFSLTSNMTLQVSGHSPLTMPPSAASTEYFLPWLLHQGIFQTRDGGLLVIKFHLGCERWHTPTWDLSW
jgi:hypothetical protein